MQGESSLRYLSIMQIAITHMIPKTEYILLSLHVPHVVKSFSHSTFGSLCVCMLCILSLLQLGTLFSHRSHLISYPGKLHIKRYIVEFWGSKVAFMILYAHT